MILRVLCAPLSLTSFLICLAISHLAPPFFSPPCAQSLLHLSHLPPLPLSLAPPTLPFPLTCRLPPCLGVPLLLPLPRSLFPFRLLLLLPCLPLLVFLTLPLLPLLSRVLPWYWGWVWVSLLLRGFPLPLLVRQLLMRMPLPPTRLIPTCPLSLLLMMMIASQAKFMTLSIPRLLRCLWTLRARNIAARLIIFAVYFLKRLVCCLLLPLRMPCSSLSLLLRLRRLLRFSLMGLTGCALSR